MLKTIVAFMAVIGASAVAQAGALAPTKASQLVSLQASAPNPACGGIGSPFTNRVTSEGQVATGFAVPPKQVLVLTSIQWAVFGVDASATTFVILTANGNGSTTFFLGESQSDANGTAGGIASFSHAIRPGTTICISSAGATSVSATLHGFLAKDR